MSNIKNKYHDIICAIQDDGEPEPPTMGPSRNGSKYCANAEGGRNGSIASGGTITYCTCDRCF